MDDEIKSVAKAFKERTKNLTQEESLAHFEGQKEQYEREYADFLAHYERDECYLCQKPYSTISKNRPCVHWLLRSGREVGEILDFSNQNQ